MDASDGCGTAAVTAHACFCWLSVLMLVCHNLCGCAAYLHLVVCSETSTAIIECRLRSDGLQLLVALAVCVPAAV